MNGSRGRDGWWEKMLSGRQWCNARGQLKSESFQICYKTMREDGWRRNRMLCLRRKTTRFDLPRSSALDTYIRWCNDWIAWASRCDRKTCNHRTSVHLGWTNLARGRFQASAWRSLGLYRIARERRREELAWGAKDEPVYVRTVYIQDEDRAPRIERASANGVADGAISARDSSNRRRSSSRAMEGM